MKDIKEAIQRSISTDSISRAKVSAPDIYDALSEVDYEEAVHIRDFDEDFYDVWGSDDDGNQWRVYVTLER